MAEFTAMQIVVLLFGGGGLIAGLVALGTLVANRIDKKRERDKAKLDTHITESVELRKLEETKREKTIDEIWRMLDEKKQEVASLEGKLRELEQVHTLSSPIIKKINNGMRELNRQIESVAFLIKRREAWDVLEREFMLIQQKFNELDKLIP